MIRDKAATYRRLLAEAQLLRERGSGAMDPADEAEHLAHAVLGVLIETLETLAAE